MDSPSLVAVCTETSYNQFTTDFHQQESWIKSITYSSCSKSIYQMQANNNIKVKLVTTFEEIHLD